MIFSLGQMGQWVFDRFLIATGKSKLFLISLGVASIVNLVLDPVLIFGISIFPKMGTAGAAAATVIGQFCGAAAGIAVNKKWNRAIPIVFWGRLDRTSIGEILKVGIPTIIMQSIVSMTGIVMNTVLQTFSYTAVAVMGVCSRISGLATIPVNGINCGIIPIIAYNYGAGNKERIYETIKFCLLYGLGMMFVVWGLLTVFAEPVMVLFDASDEMLGLGVSALRIFAVSYFLSTVGMIFSTVFQALGNGGYSMVLTVTRQAVLPVGLALCFSFTGILWTVWFSFVLAELLSMPLSLFFMRKIKYRLTLMDD